MTLPNALAQSALSSSTAGFTFTHCKTLKPSRKKFLKGGSPCRKRRNRQSEKKSISVFDAGGFVGVPVFHFVECGFSGPESEAQRCVSGSTVTRLRPLKIISLRISKTNRIGAMCDQ